MELPGQGYLLIIGMIAVGVTLLLVSIYINRSVARSVLREERHHERLYEYHRNTFSQLGVILIGIGVSLFIFFYQQKYLTQAEQQSQYQQVLAKMATRVSKSAGTLRLIAEYDSFLDDGGPYKNPEDGGDNRAVTATGSDLARKVVELQSLRREVDLSALSLMKLSDDFDDTQVVNQMDPRLWFNTVEDESELDYAALQLVANFRDLDQALDGQDPAQAVADPEKHDAIKREMLDIMYDLDFVRDRSRRLVGRGCWFLSQGTAFVDLEVNEVLDTRTAAHQEWLDAAKAELSQHALGKENCYAMLSPPEG